MKLAFITGATKGIGRSTAITFANAGWDLILLSRNMDLMEKLRSELLTTKSKINLIKCDLSNPLEIENCVKEAIEKYGCPSVLINNAGCAFNGPLVEMDLGQWGTNYSNKPHKCFSNLQLNNPSNEKKWWFSY